MKKVEEPKLIREETVQRLSIKLIRGDIARVGGAVVLCPTNRTVSQNSNLSSYLVASAGNRVMIEIRQWKSANNPLEPGDIAVTTAGNLPMIHMFHVCIPEYRRDDPEPQVRMVVSKVLQKTEELKAQSVVMPCLPQNVFGFTPEQTAFGYFSSVMDYINSHPESDLKEVKFVTLDKNATNLFEREADRRFGVTDTPGFFSRFKKNKKVEEPSDIELK
jgi:O-acetyl-ADP-ribose deacetylase